MMMSPWQIASQFRQAPPPGGSCILQDSLAICPFQPAVQLLELGQPIFAQAVAARMLLKNIEIDNCQPVQNSLGQAARTLPHT